MLPFFCLMILDSVLVDDAENTSFLDNSYNSLASAHWLDKLSNSSHEIQMKIIVSMILNKMECPKIKKSLTMVILV